MPIYEYECKKCHHRFEELVRPGSAPECPECHSRSLEKLLSAFAVGSEPKPAMPCANPCAPCAEAGACRMESMDCG